MSKREDRRTIVARTLETHGAMTYAELATITGLSIPACQRAVSDLQQVEELCVSVPAPANGYRVSMEIDDVRAGEANQLRHLATRNATGAVRLNTLGDNIGDPAVGALVRSVARMEAAQIESMRDLAVLLDA